MSDYGFKIAQAGYDVKTALDSQLVMTSKLNSYKIQNNLQGSTTQSVPAGSSLVINITHSLGYIPTFDGFFKDETGEWHSIFENVNLAGLRNIFAFTGSNQYATSSLISIKIGNRGGANQNVTVYYIIFLDPLP